MSDVIDINKQIREHGIRNEQELIKELESIFNSFSIDTQLNTPDWMLAEYVVSHLTDLKLLFKQREDFKP